MIKNNSFLLKFKRAFIKYFEVDENCIYLAYDNYSKEYVTTRKEYASMQRFDFIFTEEKLKTLILPKVLKKEMFEKEFLN